MKQFIVTYYCILISDLYFYKSVLSIKGLSSIFFSFRHNAKPNIPYIPGIESFEGEHRHSHYYKHNGPFKDKNVLIIGQGQSGLDISLECAEVANKASNFQ